MRAYLDASVLIALLTTDALTGRAEAFLKVYAPILVVSDFATAEFSSAMARRVRTGELTAAEAASAFSVLDAWVARVAEHVEIAPADLRIAERYLRRLDLTLRAPDAIHLALSQRADAALATFDAKLSAVAVRIGAAIAPA